MVINDTFSPFHHGLGLSIVKIEVSEKQDKT